jgi:putative transposase
MSKAEEEEQARLERARAIGLFRYMLIREAADPALTSRQRGAMVRELAAREHAGPSGQPVRVTRWTLDVWIRRWRDGGFDALVPHPRQSAPRTPPEVIELAAALKKENPARTAAQVQRILRAQSGWAPDERTIQRMFNRTGLRTLTPPEAAPVFGRFEAGQPNEIWTGDALHAIRVAGRKTYLFAFLDDHSRAVMAARFGFAEDTVRLAAALRPALGSRGVPEHVYVDNGSAFVDAWLLRACAVLGIKLVHSQPGRPEGRGKIERFFRTVRGQFLAELTEDRAAQIPDLAELNRLFTAWVETVYHVREHSETGQPPLARWEAGGPFPVPSPATLANAFRWSEWRTVSKTSTVSMHGNRYEVDPGLAGQRVELVFDPFDLTVLWVRSGGTDAGTATPHHITRHSHPKARPEPLPGDDAPAPPASTTSPCSATSTTSRSPAGSTTPLSPATTVTASPAAKEKETVVDDFRQMINYDELTSDDTITLARVAAEAIRGLNHTTRHDAGLDQPSVAYDTIGALSLAASGLPQLVTQITGYLEGALQAGLLGHDLGEDPAPDVSGAGIFLDDARLHADALAGSLNEAQQQLARINGLPSLHRKDTRQP